MTSTETGARRTETVETETVEVEVWRMAPRQTSRPTPQKRGGRREDDRGAKPGRRGERPQGKDRKPRRGGDAKRDGGRGAPPNRSSGYGARRTREPDPNSPFAVLATLKSGGEAEKSSDETSAPAADAAPPSDETERS
ncbi:MAG: hypothetical protein ACFB00_13440 [Parvularculaceae bacterium]